MSAIMLEALKKYQLVALIIYGKAPSIPKYCSQIVIRYQKERIPAYADFATTFATANADDTKATAEKHADTFKKVRHQ
jgi:COP9 signalosome complex subunit 3